MNWVLCGGSYCPLFIYSFCYSKWVFYLMERENNCMHNAFCHTPQRWRYSIVFCFRANGTQLTRNIVKTAESSLNPCHECAIHPTPSLLFLDNLILFKNVFVSYFSWTYVSLFTIFKSISWCFWIFKSIWWLVCGKTEIDAKKATTTNRECPSGICLEYQVKNSREKRWFRSLYSIN